VVAGHSLPVFDATMFSRNRLVFYVTRISTPFETS
jgi:hypothetical protein